MAVTFCMAQYICLATKISNILYSYRLEINTISLLHGHYSCPGDVKG